MKKIQHEAVRFSKFGVIGLTNNTALYVLFVVAIYLGVSSVVAAGLCYLLGVVLSYVLNRSWSFKSTRSHGHDLPKFLAAYGIGLACTLITIVVLTKWLPPEIAQIFNIAITAIVIYSMLRILQFGKGATDHAN